MAMVVRANKESSELGGHIASFASAATLYDVGFNHFFRGKGDGGYGDQIFFQGHAAPGIYARAFLEAPEYNPARAVRSLQMFVRRIL